MRVRIPRFFMATTATQQPTLQIETLSTGGCDPTEIYRRVAHGPSVLLDGAGWFDGRCALIGLLPFGAFQSRGASSEFHYFGLDIDHPAIWCDAGNPAAHLQGWLDRFSLPPISTADVPFSGGAIGFIAYEFAGQLEKRPGPPISDPNLFDLHLFFFDLVLLIDRATDQVQIVFNPLPQMRMGKDAEAARRAGREKIDTVRQWLAETPGPLSPDVSVLSSGASVRYDTTPADYMAQVNRVLEYIAAGDVFQVNLSHRLRVPAEKTAAFSVYQKLARINPSPFSAYCDMGKVQIACGSPERLVRLFQRGGQRFVETWPIAGTRPRGVTVAEDNEMVAALHASRKERAEHLMLVDLARNDLGRVCRFGTVHVASLMETEKYSHVIHLVSRVAGEAADGTTPLSAMAALFPGGTITGVPKIRCMEIIAELEGQPRGIYTGAIGYIGFDGEMDFNIAIRTWVQRAGEMTARVGGGIVADSRPDAEYQETMQKAAALIAALG